MKSKRNHSVYRASLGFLILLCGTLLASDFQQSGASSALVGPAGIGDHPQEQRPFVQKAAAHAVSIPVRYMPTTKGDAPLREVPIGRFSGPPLEGLAPGQADPVLQREKPRQQEPGVGPGVSLFPGIT